MNGRACLVPVVPARLAVVRAEFEGYQQGYEDGKRRGVNEDHARVPGLTPKASSATDGQVLHLASHLLTSLPL